MVGRIERMPRSPRTNSLPHANDLLRIEIADAPGSDVGKAFGDVLAEASDETVLYSGIACERRKKFYTCLIQRRPLVFSSSLATKMSWHCRSVPR